MNLTWDQVIDKVDYLDLHIYNRAGSRIHHGPLPENRIWGIPRGGSIVVGLLLAKNQFLLEAKSPEEATILIDDVIDSGKTRDRMKEKYGLDTLALVDKREEEITDWVTFPWEVGESPLSLIREEPIKTEDGNFIVSYETRECPLDHIEKQSKQALTLVLKRLDLTTHYLCSLCYRTYCFVGETVSVLDFKSSTRRPRGIKLSADRAIHLLAELTGVTKEEVAEALEKKASADAVRRDVEARTL